MQTSVVGMVLVRLYYKNGLQIMLRKWEVGVKRKWMIIKDLGQRPWLKNWIGLRSGESEKVGLSWGKSQKRKRTYKNKLISP